MNEYRDELKAAITALESRIATAEELVSWLTRETWGPEELDVDRNALAVARFINGEAAA